MFPTRAMTILGGDSFRDEYSLEFDGSNDSVLTTGDDTAADATYVWWMKSDITGKNKGVFGHGSQNRGAFHLNYNNSNPLWFRGGSNYRYWDNTSAQDDGQWHQWVVVNDHSDITACKLYIDGIEQSVSTDPATVGTGGVTAYNTNLCIGADVDGTNHFAGNISEFAWYDTMLTDGQIKTIYNSREPYNNKEGVASSNLQGWWRMGDGLERGSGTTIYDMSDNSNNGTMTNMDAVDFTGDTP